MSAAAAFSLARRLRAGETVFSGWCSLGAPVVAELVAREGFVAVNLDQQHGLFDMASTAQGIASVRAAGAAPTVRIPLYDWAVASRVLDLGAEGVIAPMINTPADAKAFVAATKFPPIGDRSWGPTRAMSLAGISDPKVYLQTANAEVVTIAMIETRIALDNVEAIAAMPGIDALFVGPSDLSVTLSNGQILDPLSAQVERELDRVIELAGRHKKTAGAYCADAKRALALANRGFKYLAVGNDLVFLRAGTAAQVAALKS